MRKSIVLWIALACAVGGVLGLHWLGRMKQERIRELRQTDVQALVRVCFSDTNIVTTQDLLDAAGSQGVRLQSPIAKDPSLPCYRLVNPPNLTNRAVLNKILLEEVNTTDKNQMVIAVMDGSVLFISRNALGERNHF